MIGDDHDLVRVAFVNERIAQRSAGIGADLPGGIAVFIRGGSADKGNIDVELSCFDRSGP